MNQFVFPRTDAGVAAQAVVVATILAVALWRSWDRPDLRLLLLGVGVATFAFMALRAAH